MDKLSPLPPRDEDGLYMPSPGPFHIHFPELSSRHVPVKVPSYQYEAEIDCNSIDFLGSGMR